MSNWTSEDAKEFLGIIRNEAAKVFRDLSSQTSSICACLAIVADIDESGNISVRLLNSPDDGSQDFAVRNRSASTLEVGDSVWLHYWGDYTNAYIAVRNMGDVVDAVTADSIGAISYIGDQGLDVDERAQARENIGIGDIITDNLTGTSADKVLSENQGRVLNDKIASEKSDLEGEKMGALELLWTNASPSSSFAAQTISLQLSNYDAIKVVVYSSTSLSTKVTFDSIPVGETIILPFMFSMSTTRDATVSSSGVVFGDGKYYAAYNNTTLTTSNTSIIPYQIYGIKRLYAA